ncbi:MAG: glycosyltransferase [Desulfobacterales bacterium]|nr:glycosyltransferase [Desulfobacterales bacterium]
MQTEEKLIPYKTSNLTGKRVLVFAPHPDDETIGCGGALTLHSEAGDPVKIVFLTDGARGDAAGSMDSEAYVALRQKEAMDACACLGVTDLEFCSYMDRELAGSRGALRRVMDFIEDFQPELIYAPSALEIHPDHRATAFLVFDALRSCGLDLDTAFYEVGQPLSSVNILIDITPVLDRKLQAISVYESQLREKPYGDICIALNRFRSLTLADTISHAEGFSLWKSDTLQKIGLTSLPFHHLHSFGPDPGEAGPLVSIIVRTKDRPSLLKNALNSIVRQTYANLEIVVINDGGRDVEDVVNTLAGDIPTTYISHEASKGKSAAANTGLKAARGYYLNFLDDDDVFYPDHVETLVSHLLATEEKVVYSSVLNVYFNGPPDMPESRSREELMFDIDFDPDRLLFENYIPVISVMFCRDILSQFKGLSKDFTFLENWDFWIRISRHFTFKHVDRVTAEYRVYSNC